MESKLYKKLDKNKVRCQTCAHNCVLSPGDFGLCGVRYNKEGILKVLNYKRAISLSADPIEKKPLYHFLPETKSFSVATVGCNFSCDFCQNASISQFSAQQNENKVPGKKISPKEIVKKAKKAKCKSIAYTYTEPTIFFEYALEIMKEAKKQNLKNVWVTNGYMSEEALAEIIPYLDAAAVDLKSFSNDFYQNRCNAQIKPVLRNLKLLKREGAWLEVITLLIPKENDSKEELKSIAEFIKEKLGASTPWHLSRFRPAFKMKDKRPTKPEKIKQVFQIGNNTGLEYVYAGNIRMPKLTETHCPNCNETVIERVGFRAQVLAEDGKCPNCNEEIAGVWE